MRKFVSVVAMTMLAAAPFLSIGCGGETSGTPTADKKAPADDKPKAKSKGAKASSKKSGAESGSTNGGGVKPPVSK